MKGQEIRQGLKTAEEDVRVSPMLRARTLRAMRESGKPKTVRVKKKASFVLAAALVKKRAGCTQQGQGSGSFDNFFHDRF